ncbi:uncharacterized protein ColSpa_06041 [Colletotrichum spaethianum]|uniref:Uncharacterized protein n=1 Tax=Colletotrichum spaethianum TaxID=700344 RepID=A0AA37P0N9_9PEZI|nr:uncharacterized protein ColSpa_06041 [Colletotrichum spaethianum]GKT45860.1 hypothetical protein ColSpa_06041 [Colletotrichum spaethianum]
MRLLCALVTCLLLTLRGARAENRFRRPPGPGPAGDFRDNPPKTRSLGMLWTVSYNGFPSHFDATKSPVYFIQMFKSGDTVGNITSHYFNITESAAASASSTSATASSTSSVSVGSTASASPSASSAAESTDKGVSTGAVAGIAVGAARCRVGGVDLLETLAEEERGWLSGAHEAVGSDEKEYYSGPVDSQARYEVDGGPALFEMPGEIQVGHNRNTP